jgi:hypothetical protein
VSCVGAFLCAASAVIRNVTINDTNVNIPLTTVSYIGEGFNETNTSLSASIKEEYLFELFLHQKWKTKYL